MATSNSSVLPRITWSGFDRAPNVARNACSSGRRSLPSSGRQPDWASRPRAMPSTRRSKICATSAPESRVQTGGIDSARAVERVADQRVVGTVGGVQPAADGERAFLGDRRKDASARHGAAGECGDAREPRDRVGHVVGVGQIGQPHGHAERVELHRRHVHRGEIGNLHGEATDRAVGDGRVVPADAHPVGSAGAEPAVEPGHARRVDAVPAPDVERAAAPRALGNVGRAVARHRVDPTDPLRHCPFHRFPRTGFASGFRRAGSRKSRRKRVIGSVGFRIRPGGRVTRR